ncbi:MAG: RsmE family RNA methyltransferase [Marinoscillum sp.]
MLYFYQPEISNGIHQLVDEEHQHCTKVLRKGAGDEIGIFDGIGGKYKVCLTEVTKKQSTFEIIQSEQIPAKTFYNHIGIAPTKNTERIEWFVEKACELGVDEISFILTSNCERNKLRIDRLEKKAVSALKQSKSGYLTKINELTKFKDFIVNSPDQKKYIAVVEDNLPYLGAILKANTNTCILIGPEGDFSPDEVQMAVGQGFVKTSLGKSTLRTETAGIVAANFVNLMNLY